MSAPPRQSLRSLLRSYEAAIRPRSVRALGKSGASFTAGQNGSPLSSPRSAAPWADVQEGSPCNSPRLAAPRLDVQEASPFNSPRSAVPRLDVQEGSPFNSPRSAVPRLDVHEGSPFNSPRSAAPRSDAQEGSPHNSPRLVGFCSDSGLATLSVAASFTKPARALGWSCPSRRVHASPDGGGGDPSSNGHVVHGNSSGNGGEIPFFLPVRAASVSTWLASQRACSLQESTSVSDGAEEGGGSSGVVHFCSTVEGGVQVPPQSGSVVSPRGSLLARMASVMARKLERIKL